MLGVAKIHAVPGAGFETGITGDRVGQRHAFIERADKNRLPPSAGQAGNGDSGRVGVRMREQDVEALAHVQKKRRDAGRAAQIHLVHLIMAHATGELPHADPLDVQRDHATLGLVDTAQLFVVRRLALAVVAVDVEHDGAFAGKFGRLVKQRGNPPAGHGFKSQFADAVPRQSFDRVAPLHSKRRVPPLGRLAAKDHFVENVSAILAVLGLPFGGGAHARHVRHTRLVEHAYLLQRKSRPDDFLRECPLDSTGRFSRLANDPAK